MEYKKQRSYKIPTPRRRKLTRLLIRGKPQSVANQIMLDSRYCQSVLTRIGCVIGKEVASLCSDNLSSVLRKTEKENLMTFKWDELFQEATQYAPCLVKILVVAFKVMNKKKSYIQPISLIISLLCTFRRRTMNMVQKIISVILFAGHCSKQVIRTLCYYHIPICDISGL